MKPTKYTALSADWTVNLATARFSSPSKDETPNQMVIFGPRMKDGAISTSMTPIAGQPDLNLRHDLRECGVLFRYNDREQFYVAGIGGFGQKFFIAKVSASEWRLLAGTGSAKSVMFHEPYYLRVEFNGERIILFHNDLPILRARDDTYFSGFCGLRANKTEADFENVDIQAKKPRCFVIMPFDPKLDCVYHIIKETVEENDMDCLRADERFTSKPIMEDVKSEIAAADIVVVDFTNRNPNVYFEAGLADAYRKKWIVLCQSTNDLAFDVKHIRTILYSNEMVADHTLRKRLQQTLEATLGESSAAGE